MHFYAPISKKKGYIVLMAVMSIDLSVDQSECRQTSWLDTSHAHWPWTVDDPF